MTTKVKSIIEVLEETRKDRGLSQRSASEALGTTPTTWRNWLRGQIPGWDWLEAFEAWTGLPRDEIIGAIAEHARRHPDFVSPLRPVPSGRRNVDYGTNDPTWYERLIPDLPAPVTLKAA